MGRGGGVKGQLTICDSSLGFSSEPIVSFSKNKDLFCNQGLCMTHNSKGAVRSFGEEDTDLHPLILKNVYV